MPSLILEEGRQELDALLKEKGIPLDLKAVLDYRDKKNYTVLMMAAKEGKLKAIQFLLSIPAILNNEKYLNEDDKETGINSHSGNGINALEIAAMHGHSEIISLLQM